MKGQTYLILAVLFAVIIAIFAVINVDPVEVNYLFGTGEAPLILIILFSVLMGVVITAASGVVRILRLQRELRAAKLELSALQQDEKNNQYPAKTDKTDGLNEDNGDKVK
ncbi:lipopolysaccharide assembly protein LapA domain-containing protein [Gracilibacillus caseinilyticus]|uniref:Lipopolysaccharide assembly protein LapA domain-containing protein n=1 Tax=Gracilibacillus caseinilyticus TaxID=2932256 RepID=A0ABY4ESU4_9BACI|nr:lipopolysaccharide assembly protein LapA domain-containing protein [Gracilibacillus caseinilyticus]UOQ47329.1 lipopolysaccharide assembly protein LapA domain-containing protein [Gracilibacillus caseinilyticus]